MPTAQRTLKVPQVQYRAGTASIDKEKGTVRLSISSETPYKRYDWWDDEFYWEVLDHGPDGIDMERLKSGTPLLFNHDRDLILGRQVGHEVKDGRCYVDVKMSMAPDVESYRIKMDEEILVDTSVGYQLVGDGVCIGAKDELPIYKFKFAPFEQSMVSIPADISVGKNRQRDGKPDNDPSLPFWTRGHKPEGEPRELSIDLDITSALTKSLDSEKKSSQKRTPDPAMEPTAAEILAQQKSSDEKIVKEAREEAIKAERKRVADIREFAASVSGARKIDLSGAESEHISTGKSFDEFRQWVLMNEFKAKPLETPTNEGSGANRGQPNGHEALTIGQEFVRSKGFKEFAGGGNPPRGGFRADLHRSLLMPRVRAGFTSSDLANVNITVSAGLIALGVQPLSIMDLIAPGTMDTAGFVYPVENTLTTAQVAKAVAERGLKPEWEPDITTDRADAKIIAVMATVPKQFLADFAAFSSYLDTRGKYLVDIETERQILYGDGLGENLKGITNRVGIQARAIGSDTAPDSLFKAGTDVQVNAQFMIDGYAIHPYDWENIRLLKDLNGVYIAGGPFYAPYGTGGYVEFVTLWGKKCVVSTSVIQGRPIAGAWKLGAQFFLREGMSIETTNSHKDYFQRNLLAVLFEHRGALAVYRPSCFVELTGFPARA